MTIDYLEIADEQENPEQGMFELKRSLRSMIGSVLVLMLVIVILECFCHLFPVLSVSGLFSMPSRILFLVPLLGISELIRKYHDDLYVFGAEFLTAFKGRYSLRHTIPRVSYRDIRNLRVSQSIFGRILNYGTLKIHTSALNSSQVELRGVADPIKLSKLISELQTQALGVGSVKSDDAAPFDSDSACVEEEVLEILNLNADSLSNLHMSSRSFRGSV